MKHLFFLSFLLLFQICVGQNQKIERVLKSNEHDTTKLNALAEYGENCDTKELKWVGDKELKLANELLAKQPQFNIQAKKHIANAYNNIGLFYDLNAQGEKALSYYKMQLPILQEIKNLKGLAVCLFNTAAIYKSFGQIDLSLETYHKSLSYFEITLDKDGLAHCYMNIGRLYKSQKEFDKALEFYQKSLKYSSEAKDTSSIAYCLNDLGIINILLKDYNKALDYFKKSFELSMKINDNVGSGAALDHIAEVYSKNNKHELALKTRLEAFDLLKLSGDKILISKSLSNIGIDYLNLKDYKMAESYSKKSFELASAISYPELLAGTSKSLYNIYKAQAKYKEALEMHEIYKQMNDSIVNSETQKNTIRKQMNYDFKIKEDENKIKQAAKDALVMAETKRKNVIIWSIGLILVIVIVFAFVAYRLYLQKQKDNRAIAIQKSIIEEKQTEILDSILYARRIQQALMPSEKRFQKDLLKTKQ